MSLRKVGHLIVAVIIYASYSVCGLDFEAEWPAATNPIQSSDAVNHVRTGTNTNIIARYPSADGNTYPCVYTGYDSKYNCLSSTLTTMRFTVTQALNSAIEVLLNTNHNIKFTFEWHPILFGVIPENAVSYGMMGSNAVYVARAESNDHWFFGAYDATWNCPKVAFYGSGIYTFMDSCLNPQVLVFEVRGLVLLGGSATSTGNIAPLPVVNIPEIEAEFADAMDGNDLTCHDLGGDNVYRLDIALPESSSTVQIGIVFEGVNPSCGEPMFLAYTVAKGSNSVVVQCSATETDRSADKVTCATTCSCHGPCFMMFLQILNQNWSSNRINKICEINPNIP